KPTTSRLYLTRVRSGILSRLYPATVAVPAEGRSRPPRTLSSVVLPEPELPMIAIISPRCTVRSRPCKARASRSWTLKILTRFSQATSGSAVGTWNSMLAGLLTELRRFVNLHAEQHRHHHRHGQRQHDGQHDVELEDLIPGRVDQERGHIGVGIEVDVHEGDEEGTGVPADGGAHGHTEHEQEELLEAEQRHQPPDRQADGAHDAQLLQATLIAQEGVEQETHHGEQRRDQEADRQDAEEARGV